MNWLKDRFKYAFSGLSYAFRDKSILFQCILGIVAFLVSALLKCSVFEWLWILLAITLVISFEIINSCIEGLVDYISLKKDPRAKKIKDMAASAVLLASVFALIVAIVIYIPKLLG